MKALVPLSLLPAIGLSLFGPHFLIADENPDEAKEESGLVLAAVAWLLSFSTKADSSAMSPIASRSKTWWPG